MFASDQIPSYSQAEYLNGLAHKGFYGLGGKWIKPRVRVKMGRSYLLSSQEAKSIEEYAAYSYSKIPKLTVRISVRGDCGIVHPSFEDWQQCKACERSLARALLR